MTGEVPSPTAQHHPFTAAHRRYAEDELTVAIANGVTQCVVLGAGQDANAYCDAHPDLRVFEVDCSASRPLSSILKNRGFQAGEISFFSWLGGRLYETAETVMAALGFIGSLPAGSSVVFDYAAERSALDSTDRLAMDPLASRVGSAGEPPRWCLNPSALHGMLRAAGFHQIQDLGPKEIYSLYAGVATECGYAHLVSARV
jgi:O-methyltransferase involved in polyketide biosynthesis